MNWNATFGVAATISLSLPVATILYYRLFRHRSLLALLLCYLSSGIYSMLQAGWIPAPADITRVFGILNNFCDIPLMLTALLFFCPIRQKQKRVHLITFLFIAYEVVIACVFGINQQAMIYIMGPGLALIIGYTFYLFARHVRITVEFGKNAGRTIMLVAILFSYGCYGLVYYFYYIQRTPFVQDVFLLYFISTMVSSALMRVGLQFTSKRMKELQEVRNTRKELALFFNS